MRAAMAETRRVSLVPPLVFARLHSEFRRLIGARLIAPEHAVPSAVIALLRVADLLIVLPAAVLELHPRPDAVREEAHFDLRRSVPTRRAPGEGHEGRRSIRSHPPNIVFCPVNIEFVEAAAHSSFNEQV